MKTLIITVLVVLVTAWQSIAQDSGVKHRLSVEFRPSASFATNDLGGADIGAGGGFETTISFRFMPHLSAYAGWGWNTFKSNDPLTGTDDSNFEETGYTFGVQFIHPLPSTKISYMVGVGAIANHIEVEDSEGDIYADSGHGLGWQAECGLAIPVGEKWRLIPGIRYRSLSRDIQYGPTVTPLDLRYISIGMGVNWTF
jgi:hypothetical protein